MLPQLPSNTLFAPLVQVPLFLPLDFTTAVAHHSHTCPTAIVVSSPLLCNCLYHVSTTITSNTVSTISASYHCCTPFLPDPITTMFHHYIAASPCPISTVLPQLPCPVTIVSNHCHVSHLPFGSQASSCAAPGPSRSIDLAV